MKYARPHGLEELRDHGRAANVALLVGAAIVVTAAVLSWFDALGPSDDRSAGASLLPRAPAELPTVGSFSESRILANGTIRVDQWVRTRRPVTEVELVVPGGTGPGGQPVASGVRVVVDLLPVSGSTTVRTSAHYELGVPSTLIRLRYNLIGAVVRSPSVPGRALARYTSGRVRVAGTAGTAGPAILRISGGQVLSAACSAPSRGTPETSATSAASGTTPRPCGSPQGRAWRVQLSGAHRGDDVMAQVNLG